MNKKVIGGVAGLAVVGVVGSGAYLVAPAFAGTSSGTPSPSATAPGTHKKGHHHRRAVVGLHGMATVKTKKGFAQVAWQRGQITAAGTTLTVRSADGTSWQWSTTQNTRVRKNGQKSTIAQLAQNDSVVVYGTVSGGKDTAKAIVVPKTTRG